MKIGVYPGSFDPFTLGHLDITNRASKLFDKVVIGVLNNAVKKQALFTVDERVDMIKKSTSYLENVEVKSFSGLSIDFAKMCGADCIIRGVRLVSDFEFELQMAQTNKILDNSIETIFLITNKDYSFVSSSTVKDLAKCGGDIAHFVSDNIRDMVMNKCKMEEKI